MKTLNIETIKELREKTGAGLSDCKKALNSCDADMTKAAEWLKQKGLAQLAKRAGKQAQEGAVASYIHAEGKIGVLVEVNTETDFSARSEAFKNFVKHLTLHITAMNPLVISKENLPQERIKEQKEFFKKQAIEEGKKDQVLDAVLKGRMEKWMKEVCLLDQIFFHPDNKDESQTVEGALAELVSQVREKIVIRRFVRYELGASPETNLDTKEEPQH